MDKERFKEELRGKVHDFSTTCALINLSDSKPKGKKERDVEEKYLKLENWIIEGIEELKHPLISTETAPVPAVPDENQTDLGF